MDKYKGMLTVVPSFFYHDDVTILGTAKALRELRDKIDECLKSNSAEFSVMNTDGEEYDVKIKQLSEDNMKQHAPIYVALPDTYMRPL